MPEKNTIPKLQRGGKKGDAPKLAPAPPLVDLSRLAIHTMTNKPWSLQQCIDGYATAGLRGLTVWRNVVEDIGAEEAGKLLRSSGLQTIALVRSGFFPAPDSAGRQAAIEDNRLCIEQAATIGAPMIVLVCGAIPGMPLAEARRQIADGIEKLLPLAESHGVKLAIEPLHPMYSADRSAINTMAQARAVCEALRHPMLGIACDVYHVWWDPDLQKEITLAGQMKTLFALHLCDWRVNTRDLLNDRGLMGEGCIDLRTIRGWAEAAGFKGWNEVEIFSTERWAGDQTKYVEQIKQAYLDHG